MKKKNKVIITPRKGIKIVITASEKITDDSYELIKVLFGMDDVFLTDESRLEDFLDNTSTRSITEELELHVDQIADKYGVVLPEILEGKTRIWEVMDGIIQKQRN